MTSLTSLDHLLLISALTLGLMLLIGGMRIAGAVSVVLYAAQFAALIATGTLFGEPVASSFVLQVLDQNLHWRFDALSWFFGMITIGAAFVSAWYAAGAFMDRFREQGHSPRLFHVALALNVFSMLLLLGSGDFLSLFLGWELVFLMVIGIGAGTGIGVWISNLFIPYLQVGSGPAAQVPPFVVQISWPDVFRFYILFGLLFAGALAILVVLLLRMRIFQAIKLGETA